MGSEPRGPGGVNTLMTREEIERRLGRLIYGGPLTEMQVANVADEIQTMLRQALADRDQWWREKVEVHMALACSDVEDLGLPEETWKAIHEAFCKPSPREWKGPKAT